MGRRRKNADNSNSSKKKGQINMSINHPVPIVSGAGTRPKAHRAKSSVYLVWMDVCLLSLYLMVSVILGSWNKKMTFQSQLHNVNGVLMLVEEYIQSCVGVMKEVTIMPFDVAERLTHRSGPLSWAWKYEKASSWWGRNGAQDIPGSGTARLREYLKCRLDGRMLCASLWCLCRNYLVERVTASELGWSLISEDLIYHTKTILIYLLG